ncbi:TRAP transporter small permease subunit [Paracoccus saliphilus]|uniref:TRAP transporter small permease subunit n=1 Tax=Paracoccus saliphilus TaxID=405559 RepID=UPI0023501057|nr:TRAP transporter small permease subunit [Paracoccus saliphilus]
MASLTGAWLAAMCIASLTVLVLVDTLLAFVSRYLRFMPTGTGIGWEYSAYLMGAAFVLGAGLTLRAGLQLRVELLISSGKARLAWLLELFSCTLGSLVTVVLTIWLARFTLRTYGFGEVSQDSFTPLWIPQSVLTIGMAVLAFQMLARLMTCLAGGAVNNPELGVASAIE